MAESIDLALWVALAFLMAGLVKGVLGMGLPTVSMGLLGLVMAPASAAALLVVPSLVTNVWQLLAGPPVAALVRRLASMMLAVVAGTWLASGVLTGDSSSFATAALGAVLAAYGAVGLRAPQFSVPTQAEVWASPLVGLLSGLTTGATGVFVIPAVPYLNSLGLARDQLVQALGLSFTVSTLALAAALAAAGKYPLDSVGGSALAVAPALLGMVLGQRLRDKVPPERFRRAFFVAMILLGLYMVARVWLPR